MKGLLIVLLIACFGLLIAATGCSGYGKNVNYSSSCELYRPFFHFTPDSMWMNDPNGMVYFDGEYHLFYQYYPDSTVWGPMHWGHAISTDLVHWEHLPIALYPDSLGYIFSGSAVIDIDNTSGLGEKGKPAMVAIFTYHNMEMEKAGRIDYQSQGIAYSTDKGRTWTKYQGNPVIKNPGQRDFRDPKVSWHKGSSKWIMTLATGDHVCFYSSPNLKEWKLESEFGKGIGAHGGVWECPDLFELPLENQSGRKKWVLLVSINPGGLNGGSATQYFVGDFDGHTFTNESHDVRWLDYGKDNYAGVTFSNIPESDGRQILIGWMSNWQYAQVVPTKKWRSAMTFPRSLSLTEKNNSFILKSNPVVEIQHLQEQKIELEPMQLEGIMDIKPRAGIPMSPGEIILEFQIPSASAAEEFGVWLGNSGNEYIKIGYNRMKKQFYIDRSNSGISDFSKDFSGIHASSSIEETSSIRMHLLVDVASVELFANDGEIVMTDIFFPLNEYDQIKFFAEKGKVEVKSGAMYKLNAIK